MNGPIPTNMYSEGEFGNIIFLEFGDMLERDTAVALFRSARLQRGDTTVWACQDREPSERAARNFAFRLKYLLKDDM